MRSSAWCSKSRKWSWVRPVIGRQTRNLAASGWDCRCGSRAEPAATMPETPSIASCNNVNGNSRLRIETLRRMNIALWGADVRPHSGALVPGRF